MKWIDHEMRRHEAIRNAVEAADRIIMNASDGSNEEINWLTLCVAEAFIKKTMIPLKTALLQRITKLDD